LGLSCLFAITPFDIDLINESERRHMYKSNIHKTISAYKTWEPLDVSLQVFRFISNKHSKTNRGVSPMKTILILMVLCFSISVIAAEKDSPKPAADCVDGRAALIICEDDEFLTNENCAQAESYFVHCMKLQECVVDIRVALKICADGEALTHEGCKQTEIFYMRCAPKPGASDPGKL
jgi:hypothetical protein